MVGHWRALSFTYVCRLDSLCLLSEYSALTCSGFICYRACISWEPLNNGKLDFMHGKGVSRQLCRAAPPTLLFAHQHTRWSAEQGAGISAVVVCVRRRSWKWLSWLHFIKKMPVIQHCIEINLLLLGSQNTYVLFTFSHAIGVHQHVSALWDLPQGLRWRGCLGLCDHRRRHTRLERLVTTSLLSRHSSALQGGICLAEPLHGLRSAASQRIQIFIVFPLAAFQSIWKLDAISKTTDWLTVWDIVFSLASKNAVVWPKVKSPRNHTWFTTQLFDNIKSICNILKSLANYF